MRRDQAEMARYQATRNFVNLLVNDTIEYAKRDQGIVPILEVIGIRMTRNPAAGATGAAAAPTKPAGK